MIKRFLAAIFGAVLFVIIVPIGYSLTFDQFPIDGFKGIILVAGGGMALGAVLGAMFPRVFGYVFEMFLDL